ncbi:MAG TPA: isoprenyl transferase [Candidatus Anoxymicrobiaceae bacterium]|jgi:undecaprenyl diphosphate synthase
MSAKSNDLEIPRRIAIIMDGNGRWATQRGLPRIEGHREGEKAVTATVVGGAELGLEAMTLYAFSTENWKRPTDEVRFLMNFNRELLDRRVQLFHENNVKIRFIGRRDRVPKALARRMGESEETTRKNTGMKLNVAFNYGGRAEIVDAMKALGEEIVAGKLKPGSITEKSVSKHLYLPDVTDYDLMIRTAGEMRISNFLLWELAYAELYVTDITWPEFRKKDLLKAIAEYNRRIRKFGAL